MNRDLVWRRRAIFVCASLFFLVIFSMLRRNDAFDSLGFIVSAMFGVMLISLLVIKEKAKLSLKRVSVVLIAALLIGFLSIGILFIVNWPAERLMAADVIETIAFIAAVSFSSLIWLACVLAYVVTNFLFRTGKGPH